MPVKQSVKKQQNNEWSIHVIHRTALVSEIQSGEKIELPRGSFAIAGTQADSKGNVIFANAEEVSQSKFEAGFENCIQLANSMIAKAARLGKEFEVDEITLKLSANAKYGCSFIADASLEGGIEVLIKRKTATDAGVH